MLSDQGGAAVLVANYTNSRKSPDWAHVTRMKRASYLFSMLLIVCTLTLADDSVRAIIGDSDLIGFATVIGHESYSTEPGASFSIYTDTTYRIEEILKGTQGKETVVVTQYGGTVGEHRVSTSVLMLPEVGQRVVVFLRKTRKSDFAVPGRSPNAYIYTDADYGLLMIRKAEGRMIEVLIPYGKKALGNNNGNAGAKTDVWLTVTELRRYLEGVSE